jgi:proline iminopeptidase
MEIDRETLLITNTDTDLFTTLYPKLDAESIIFLHGGPGLPDGLTFIEEYLAEYYQIISFHQRGTLKSPMRSEDFSMEKYVSDIDALAAHFHVDTFHLLGHSWGGLYAQVYAEKNPHKLLSLFLCSPGSGTGLQWAETQAEIASYIANRSNGVEKAAMVIQAFLGGLGGDKGYENLYKYLIDGFNKGFSVNKPIPFELACVKAPAINHTTKAILQSPLLRQQPNPPFPVSIVYGAEDVYGDSKRYVRQRYPSAKIDFIPASGHLSWSHHPNEFIGLLKAHYQV